MRVVSIAALLLCVGNAVISPPGAVGATIPLWDASIATHVSVPAGGSASIVAPGGLFAEALDIALVMDNSGSMSYGTGQPAPNSGSARGDWARDGANAFLDTLPDESRVVLSKFANSSSILVNLEALGTLSPTSPHRMALKTMIKGLSRNDGGTNLQNGIRVAAEALANAGGTASKHIVVVTDGESTTGNPLLAVDAAIAAGIAGVHTVGLPGADINGLNAIAQRGNGQFVDGTSLTSLIAQFSSILDNADALSRLDILNSNGDVLIADLQPLSAESFEATLDIYEGVNHFFAKTTSNSGAFRTAELTIVGVAIPEPMSIGLLVMAMAPLAMVRRRRTLQRVAVMAVITLVAHQSEAGLAGKNYTSKTNQAGWALKDGVIDFSNATPGADRYDATIDFWDGLPTRHRNEFYGVEWNGYLRVETAGDYGIGTISDDGSQVWVNNSMVVDNSESQWFDWEDNLTEVSAGETPTGPLFLTRGFHAIRVRFYENQHYDGIELWWLPTGRGESHIPYLGTTFHDSNSANHPTLNSNRNWEIIPNDVLYAAIPALDGDFNSDGVVDAADYTVWRDAVSTGAPLSNDATSGASADDLARWQAAYGSIAGGAGQLAQTPEPTSGCLVAIALGFGAASLHRGPRVRRAKPSRTCW